jgi:hypothetical protein
MMQDTKVASFSQPAADFPVGLDGLVLPRRGLVAIELVNVAMFMLRAGAILVLLSPLLLTAILVG